MSALRRTSAIAAADVRATLRRGESVLLTLGIPVGLLAFFATVDVLPLPAGGTGRGDRLAFLVPGVLALAVLSTAFTSLAISTGFERGYGVLKRLGATPLRRIELVAAKALAVLAILAVQAVVIVAEALLLGWQPGAEGAPAALAVALLAAIGLAGLGMLLAGSLPALTVLAAANAAHIALLLVSGFVVPFDRLPGPLAGFARFLPSGALAEAMRAALEAGAAPGRPLLVLLAWAVVGPALAARTFRWHPEG